MANGLQLHHDGFVHAEAFFKELLGKGLNYKHLLKKAGEEGIDALKKATPRDTGLTAESWSYELKELDGKYQIIWKNSNAPEGVSVAVLIQYGHANQNGLWIEGRDYINPALKPVFDRLEKRLNEEVKYK